MKYSLRSVVSILILNLTALCSFAQVRSSAHERPVITDAVPNIPDELIESGKLSKYVTLFLPDDVRWNPDNDSLNANGAVYVINQGDGYQSCYIGGHFDVINGVQIKGVAFFDDRNGGKFSDIGGGVNGDVYALLPIRYSGELYAAGNFTKAGSTDARNIAHWTGAKWEALGNGTDSTVFAMALVAGLLYVGGNFRNAGGQAANYIAKWDTTSRTWQPVMDGTVNGMDGGVAALTLDPFGNLIAGGGFNTAGTVHANKIASLNSGKWQALRNGIEGANAYITCIAIDPAGTIHAGGSFQSAGGLALRNIAYWNGNIWLDESQYPGGFDGTVYTISTISSFTSQLYVGGNFHKTDIWDCNYIAGLGQLQGPVLGSGLDGPCYALAGKFLAILAPPGYYNNHLYVGGRFTQAGLKPSNNFAIWGAAHSGTVKEKKSFGESVTISPNPVRASTSINFSLKQRANVSISIIDELGRILRSYPSVIYEEGAHSIGLDCKELPHGMFYAILTSGAGEIQRIKFIYE